MDAFTPLRSRPLSDNNHLLLEDLTGTDTVFGPITAQRGFITNFASIEPLKNFGLFILYYLLKGYGDESATIHDWLYAGYGILRADGTRYYPTREECDEIFYRLLRAQGIARWRAMIFYVGVRLFGRSHYLPAGRVFKADPVLVV